MFINYNISYIIVKTGSENFNEYVEVFYFKL